MMEFSFLKDYHHFHTVKIINFQLNRWHSLEYARFGDLLQEAKSEQRWINAAFYYRAAEFFTLPSDPDKEALKDCFIDIFYHKVCIQEPIERILVPCKHTHLPAIRIRPAKEICRGTIVIHGRFDSFIQEFYSLAVYFSNNGYEVILFEGPGQGAALKKFGLPLTYQWEKPVEAVLDHFHMVT